MPKTKYKPTMGQIRHTARTRKKTPIIREVDGDIKILCPNCPDPHPISITQQAHCGTFVEVMAVQTIYRGRSVKCMRCDEPGGTFMKIGEDQYAHTHNCVPGRTIVTGDYELSKTAEIVWKMPDSIVLKIAKWFKRTPIQLGDTSDPEGYIWKRL